MRRGGILKKGAAALLLGLLLVLPLVALSFVGGVAQDAAAPGETQQPVRDQLAQDTATTIIVDTSSPTAASPDPQGACDCMTPILMQRLTPEAHGRMEGKRDQLPVGVLIFRDATPEEETAQRACME